MARWQRRVERGKGPTPIAAPSSVVKAPRVRVAEEPRRLVYTRTQAAEALGISPATFTRRVLPLIEMVQMPWGTCYVPVDQLERLVDEHRMPALGRPPAAPPGRPTAVPRSVVRRIQAAYAAGTSLRRIARQLNASGTPTAHGGAQWWPSTVRAVLARQRLVERTPLDS